MPSTICSTSQRCRLLKSFFYCMTLFVWGFPHSSVGKESSCNAGDLASIPGSRRSAGEGIGYPLQYSWASLVAQLVKHLPAMRKTWVQSLGWEGPLEKGKSTHSSILAWRVRHNWATFTFTLKGLMVFPTFFNLRLNLAIRSSWSEPQSAPSLVLPIV